MYVRTGKLPSNRGARRLGLQQRRRLVQRSGADQLDLDFRIRLLLSKVLFGRKYRLQDELENFTWFVNRSDATNDPHESKPSWLIFPSILIFMHYVRRKSPM